MNANDKFEILVIAVVIIWFFTVFYRADVAFAVALVIACAVVYYRLNQIKNDTGFANVNLDTKLQGLLKEENIHPPVYFYIDPDMITFFDSIKDFRIYNRDSYVRAIRTADNLLKIRKDLENDFVYTEDHELEPWQNFKGPPELQLKAKEKSNIQNYKELFEASESLGTKSLNYLQSFIISLPVHPFYTKKHKIAMARYHVLIKRNLDIILNHCRKFSRDTKNILIGVHYGKWKARDHKIGSFEFFT